jgi:hypothetical protein
MWVSVFKWLEMDSLAHQTTNRKPIARGIPRFSFPMLIKFTDNFKPLDSDTLQENTRSSKVYVQ